MRLPAPCPRFGSEDDWPLKIDAASNFAHGRDESFHQFDKTTFNTLDETTRGELGVLKLKTTPPNPPEMYSVPFFAAKTAE